jgi:adenylate cyclase
VPHAGLTWEVDVFEGAHHGLVIAEVELERADQAVPLPSWAGAEITHDLRYRSAALARAGAGWPRLSARLPAGTSAAALPLG